MGPDVNNKILTGRDNAGRAIIDYGSAIAIGYNATYLDSIREIAIFLYRDVFQDEFTMHIDL